MNTQAFFNSLPMMGQGMLSIFAVMIVIGLVITALNWITAKANKDEQ